MTTHFLFRLLHIGKAHSILSILQFVHGLPDIVTSHRTLRALQTPQALLARFLPRRNRTTLSISVFWSRSFAGCFCCWSTLSRELPSMIPSRGCNCSILNSENVVEVNILLRLKVISNYPWCGCLIGWKFRSCGKYGNPNDCVATHLERRWSTVSGGVCSPGILPFSGGAGGICPPNASPLLVSWMSIRI